MSVWRELEAPSDNRHFSNVISVDDDVVGDIFLINRRKMMSTLSSACSRNPRISLLTLISHPALVAVASSRHSLATIRNKQNSMSGIGTQLNMPLSANMAPDEVLNLVFVRGDVRFADLMSPIEGPFCYMYE